MRYHFASRATRLKRRSVRRLNMDTFQEGQLVQISATHHWAKNAFGKIAEPPMPVRKLVGDWNGCVRMVKNLQGTFPYYWVEFEEPQVDADGDGPYAGGEIDARYLVASRAV